MKNLTYDQLIELAPKDRPFQIEVNREDLTINKRFNLIEKSLLWAFIDKNKQVNTNLYSQTNVSGGLDYTETGSIAPSDKSRKIFTLIDPRYTKPEVLKVGQKVRIMESARECGDYELESARECGDYDKWYFDSKKEFIGEINKIKKVIDNSEGLSYIVGVFEFPHYCVMPVEEEDLTCVEKASIPTLDDMIEEFEGLCIKAQDIINKYKK
jgi:hypothetical protein